MKWWKRALLPRSFVLKCTDVSPPYSRSRKKSSDRKTERRRDRDG